MKEIIEIIDRKVRPALNIHNCDINRIRVMPEGFTKVRLTGACPSSQQTLSELIEAVIKAECPQIIGLIADYETSDDLISKALGILLKGRQ